MKNLDGASKWKIRPVARKALGLLIVLCLLSPGMAQPKEGKGQGNQVAEHPNVIQEIIYKNVGHISKKDLDALSQLRKGAPMNPAANRNACNSIQECLKRKGRLFANVKLEEGDQPTDRRVIFNVTEGPVVRVKKIRFVGNNEFAGEDRLATLIDSGKAFLGLLGGRFDPAIADNDVRKLTEYYRANGYKDARVTRELVFNEDFCYVDLVLHIQEGQRRRIQDDKKIDTPK